MALKRISKAHLEALRPFERALKNACRRGDGKEAETTLRQIHLLLADYGPKHPRLLEARLWYFESLLDSSHIGVAESGFVSIRSKASPGTRLHLEATFLLAVCLLRRKKHGGSKNALSVCAEAHQQNPVGKWPSAPTKTNG